MGNAPSSSRTSTPPPGAPVSARIQHPPQARSPIQRDSLPVTRRQPPPLEPEPQQTEVAAPQPPLEQDVGMEVMPGELLVTPAEERTEFDAGLAEEGQSAHQTDWAAAAAAMERAMGAMRERAITLARDGMEKRRSRLEEEERQREAREDAEGRSEQEEVELRFPPGLQEAPTVVLPAIQTEHLQVDTRVDDALTPRASERGTPLPVEHHETLVPQDDPGYGTQEGEDNDSVSASSSKEGRSTEKRVRWGAVHSSHPSDGSSEVVEVVPSVVFTDVPEVRVEGSSPPPPAELKTEEAPSPRRPLHLEVGRLEEPPLASPATVLTQPSRHASTRTLDPGVYTLTDVRWGMALDLSGGDGRSAIGFAKHGWENQQWEWSPLGAGYTIRSVQSQAYLAVDNFNNIQNGRAAPIVTSSFPACWDMEILTDDDDDDGIYARIRWPHSDLALGLGGEVPGARVLLTNDADASSTYWRLFAHPRPQITKGSPITTVSTSRREDRTRGVMMVTTTTTTTTATTKSVTRVVTTEL